MNFSQNIGNIEKVRESLEVGAIGSYEDILNYQDSSVTDSETSSMQNSDIESNNNVSFQRGLQKSDSTSAINSKKIRSPKAVRTRDNPRIFSPPNSLANSTSSAPVSPHLGEPKKTTGNLHNSTLTLTRTNYF